MLLSISIPCQASTGPSAVGPVSLPHLRLTEPELESHPPPIPQAVFSDVTLTIPGPLFSPPLDRLGIFLVTPHFPQPRRELKTG